MRVLTTTPLGRVQLALTAVLLTILALKLTVLHPLDSPSLALSLVSNSTMPLLAICLAVGFAARGEFLQRDWIAVALALALTSVAAVQGVAVDRHLGVFDTLNPFFGPLFGLTIAALIWSALGRRHR